MKAKTKKQIKNTDWKAWSVNLLKFSTPILLILLLQLQQGVSFKEALPVAIYALYGALIDLLKKFNEAK